MYYNKTKEELFEALRSSDKGLTNEEVKARLEKYGFNALEKEKGLNIPGMVLHQFTDPLIYILIIAAIITTILKDWVDTGVILAVVILNAIIGFIQEYKAENAIRALKTLTSPKAQVIRNGIVEEVDSETLVPGDIVLLASGTKVPADIRLFETIRLEIDEAALTGESLGVKKISEPVDKKETGPGEAKNKAFLGTLVLSGRGKGIVIATGQNTQLGKISHEVGIIKAAPTPLQIQLDNMSKKIGLAIVVISIISIALGVWIGESLYDMLLTGIALAVGAIPEGLPVVVTITLAIGVGKMAQRNAIIRKLPAVETLGSTTVIASDKTGTMTKNEMTVTKIFSGDRFYDVTGTGYVPIGEIVPEDGKTEDIKDNKALMMCLMAGLLANESMLELEESTGNYKHRGDPTEICLITSAMKGGLEEGKVLLDYTKLDEIPFESERLYMASLHKQEKKDENIAFIKGAPDRILKMCNRMMDQDGAHKDFNEEDIQEINSELGYRGLRILAMAFKTFPREVKDIEPKDLEEGAVFLGLQGMYDPPREEVYEAIKQAKRSGIRVIMVTGDHKVTAITIAKKLEIIDGEKYDAITGDQLEKMQDEELFDRLETVSVFSRVSPLHKLRIVQQLIKRGEVVAVTGDGVNDTPALKAAHIGVAMGKTGTDAAKETSEMIISDDNFASIFAAVKEGRVVFANIRKVTLFLLSSGMGQVILILLSLVLRLPLPLLPSQIIWTNLVTNGLQDVAMAFEPAEKGIEIEPPRKKNEPVISKLMIERLLVIGIVLAIGTLGVFLWQLNTGASIDKARTMAFTTLVLFQLFNVFNMRSETTSAFLMNPLNNKFLFFSVIASIIAQISVLYWEPLQFIFNTVPPDMNDWAMIIPVTLTVIFVVEIDKAIRNFLGKEKK
ncbi:ATPase [Methanocella sp. CWC-04]|uniref:ATPase n=1 Tax=Methanooceanicella nereidis TaxID=2052831 RepID=A0AAP2RDJ3_9EURY|nr:HAD-IC family P-type ATPase [Methanocella sp. CWC-04]MCD1295284.1 ATPase [Methanocella sp. CWC-04]